MLYRVLPSSRQYLTVGGFVTWISSQRCPSSIEHVSTRYLPENFSNCSIACQKITRKLIQGRFIQSTSEYFNKSRVDRVAEMEQTLISGDTTTKNSALASAKRLAEKKYSAEQLVKAKEEEIQSMGLVRMHYLAMCQS